jgi:hypothetical protein
VGGDSRAGLRHAATRPAHSGRTQATRSAA